MECSDWPGLIHVATLDQGVMSVHSHGLRTESDNFLSVEVGGGEQRNRLKCCAPHPNSGIQAAIQSSLKGVIYYVSFKRLSELLSQEPLHPKEQ